MATPYKSTDQALLTALALYQQRSLDIFGKVIELPVQNTFAKTYLGDFASRVLYLCIDFMDTIKTIALVNGVAVILNDGALPEETITQYALEALDDDDVLISKVKTLLDGSLFPVWNENDSSQQFYLLNRLNRAYFLPKSPYPLNDDGEYELNPETDIETKVYNLPSFCYTQGAFVLLKRPDYIELPDNVVTLEVGQVWQNESGTKTTILALSNGYVVHEVGTDQPLVATKDNFTSEYVKQIS